MSEPDFESLMISMAERFGEREASNYKTNYIECHKMRKLKIIAAREHSTREMDKCLRINLYMHYGTQPYSTMA